MPGMSFSHQQRRGKLLDPPGWRGEAMREITARHVLVHEEYVQSWNVARRVKQQFPAHILCERARGCHLASARHFASSP